MNERRTSVRHPRYKGASIVFNRLGSVISCTLRNISANGACLIVPADLFVPAEFKLLIEGAMHSCVVAWRRPERVGVKYQ
jgi:hypothetical protein